MREDRIQNLDEAIEQHLEHHGPRNWKIVRARFPDISDATFWRHVKVVRQPHTVPDAKPGEVVTPDTRGDRFFPPFFEPMKKLAEYERLLAEVEEMARQAKNNQGKIINWRMYAKSMEMRRTLLEDQITAAQMLVNMDKITRHYDLIVEALKSAPQEIVIEFAERVRELNENQLRSA